MATTDVIIQTFRSYVDEPDQTFLTDNIVDGLLNIAYQEFRDLVTDTDPNVLSRQVAVNMSSQAIVDLSAIAVPIMGPPAPAAGGVAAGDRLVRLLSVFVEDGVTGSPATMFTGVGSLQALVSEDASYYLEGTRLHLSRVVANSVQLLYVPDGTDISWTPPGSNAVIPDEVVPFHDLIPLYAMRQYQMMDSAINQPMMIQIEARERSLRNYLNARAIGGPQYVEDTL